MDLAEPIFPCSTIPTLPTRNDLFSNSTITDFEFILLSCPRPEFHHLTDEFMSSNNGCLYIRLTVFVTPEKWRACITLDVARANTARLHLNNNLAGTCLRHQDLFKAVIPRFATHNRSHRFRHFLIIDLVTIDATSQSVFSLNMYLFIIQDLRKPLRWRGLQPRQQHVIRSISWKIA